MANEYENNAAEDQALAGVVTDQLKGPHARHVSRRSSGVPRLREISCVQRTFQLVAREDRQVVD